MSDTKAPQLKNAHAVSWSRRQLTAEAGPILTGAVNQAQNKSTATKTKQNKKKGFAIWHWQRRFDV